MNKIKYENDYINNSVVEDMGKENKIVTIHESSFENKQASEGSFEDNIQQEVFKKASVGRRFWAFLIDHFVISVIIVLGIIVYSQRLSGLFFSFLLLGYLLYASRDFIKGQSLGKFILGIGVREKGNINKEQQRGEGEISSQESTPSKEVVSPKIPAKYKLFVRNLFVFLWFVDFFILLATKSKIGDKITKTDVYQLNRKHKGIFRFAALLIIPILLFGAIHIASGGSRTPLTSQEFTLRMEDQGFEVRDMMFIEVADTFGVTSYLIASQIHFWTEPDDFILIQFIEYEDNVLALMSYARERNRLENAAYGFPSSRSFVASIRTNRFAITFDGNHEVISRIDNTIVMTSTSTANGSQVNNLLKILGY